jgi:hypothetical protein
MMNYRDFIKRIQKKMGEIHLADGIVEDLWWDHVLRELNDISIDCAKELQNESGGLQYRKSSVVQPYEKMPPSRVLALTVTIVSWLGWVSHEKCGDDYNWEKIREAFEFGRNASLAGEIFRLSLCHA